MGDDVEDVAAAFVRDDSDSGGGKRKKFSGDSGSGKKRDKKFSSSNFSDRGGRNSSSRRLTNLASLTTCNSLKHLFVPSSAPANHEQASLQSQTSSLHVGFLRGFHGSRWVSIRPSDVSTQAAGYAVAVDPSYEDRASSADGIEISKIGISQEIVNALMKNQDIKNRLDVEAILQAMKNHNKPSQRRKQLTHHATITRRRDGSIGCSSKADLVTDYQRLTGFDHEATPSSLNAPYRRIIISDVMVHTT
ncbi:hypothetical protein E3N88_13719 [Mikania micrantha]|uniref:Uncharacterized protein n=1 Tax=Mikania micrantha TaxID=192012 RepID=A0A5N6NZE0_9ASTR|nr:hypothetical protein E3N88_13719 [Mikania micrantha]